MTSNKHHFLLIIFFWAAISLPLVFSDKAGGKVSKIENRNLAVFPDILTKDMKLASGIRSGLENWINDNIGFRTQVKKLQINIDFKVFDISPNNDVVVGKDGWYFYNSGNNLELALGTYPVTQDQLIKIKENQEKIQRALNNKGIEYVIVLIPSKVSIYPEYIRGDFSVRTTAIDIVADYLQKNTTIPIINVKPIFLEAKQNERIYFKNDTHWNEKGSYIGYCSIITKLNEIGIIHSSPIAISTVPGNRIGDLTVIMGISDFVPPEPTDEIQILSPNANLIQAGIYFDNLNALIKSEGGVPAVYSYQNDKIETKKLLIYGDSFFAGHLPGLLAENFSGVDYIWSHLVRNEMIELVKPNVVMLELTERNILLLAYDPDPNLVSTQ